GGGCAATGRIDLDAGNSFACGDRGLGCDPAPGAGTGPALARGRARPRPDWRRAYGWSGGCQPRAASAAGRGAASYYRINRYIRSIDGISRLFCLSLGFSLDKIDEPG